MTSLRYLLNRRSFIFLMVLFSFIDNFGKEEGEEEKKEFKVVFVGDEGVGKTQIINKIMDNSFEEKHNSTMDVNFSTYDTRYKGKNIKLELCDTPGQEKYRKLITVFLKNVHLIFLVYAIDNKNSFINIKNWVDFIKTNTNENPKLLLVGNKCDLKDQREVSTEETKEYAKKYNIKFIEVSVKKGNSFLNMLVYSLDEFLKDEKKEENKIIQKNIEVDNHKINDSQNDNNSQKKITLNKKDFPFYNKYCPCYYLFEKI